MFLKLKKWNKKLNSKEYQFFGIFVYNKIKYLYYNNLIYLLSKVQDEEIFIKDILFDLYKESSNNLYKSRASNYKYSDDSLLFKDINDESIIYIFKIYELCTNK